MQQVSHISFGIMQGQLQSPDTAGTASVVSGRISTMRSMTERTLTLDADTLERIGLEVDMRLTDIWSMLFERGTANLDTEFVGWLLRLAYVTGYWESMTEPDPGALCHTLGYPVPERRAS